MADLLFDALKPAMRLEDFSLMVTHQFSCNENGHVEQGDEENWAEDEEEIAQPLVKILRQRISVYRRWPYPGLVGIVI